SKRDWSSDVCSSDLRVAHRIIRIWIDRALLTSPPVLPRDQSAVAAGIEDVGIARVARDVPALAAADRIKHLIGAPTRSTRSALRSEERRVGKACRRC